MTTAISTKQPPAYLSAQMREWWLEVERDHALEGHHRRLLELACAAFDRAQNARKVIEAEGAIYTDRFNQAKARPEAGIERDSRRDFAAIIKQLNFDQEAPG